MCKTKLIGGLGGGGYLVSLAEFELYPTIEDYLTSIWSNDIVDI